ncbi:MAG: hypothetical protein II247_08055 [Lachnospiraceae bacterium]|nr:hypothetical protein [Lachnospiraceae bacterium]
MEKTTPERKVLLREQDVFYVYDKRINKCVKEDCEGTVKYGLILKVNMPNGDTLNTFECNKCHMKYTAYPNYVRLTSSEELTIYNRDEVEARDKKRAADAAKQEARAKKKEFAKKNSSMPYGRKPYGKQADDKKPYDRKSYEKKPYDKKSYDNKSYEKKPYEKKPYDRKSYEKRPYDQKPYDKKNYERNSYDSYQSDRNRDYRSEKDGRRTYGQKEYRGGERTAYDKKSNSGGYQKRYYKNPKMK